ncbi:MAG: SpoIIE family protein phosphatase [Bacteroidales bacterium]|jgi:ligand-binding sensor domain-containing protein/serine phosphatase RsbU (regulator of sigma subunit)|nr:SpoIIE family protein phosphatase [Bacteroidales bacterium]
MINLTNFNKTNVIRLKKRITFFCLIALLNTSTLFSQNYYFDYYSVHEGLTQSTVFDVLQDEQGYLWLGTKSGISKFDGNTFVNYSTSDGFAENAVRKIFKDSENRIWFGHTGGGISIVSDNKNYVHPLSEKINGDITSFLEDKKGRIWITTHGDGLFILENPEEKDSSKISYEQYKGKRLSDIIFSSSKCKNDTIFLITAAGIKKYVESTNAFERFHPKNLSTYFQITTMHEDRKGNIWFGTYHGGLYRYNEKSGEIIIYDSRDKLANNFISTISEDLEGNIYAGTWGGGISKFSNNSITTFDKTNGLKDEKIWCIKEDMEGNILIGTNNHGLAIFKGEKFISYNMNELSSPQVFAIQKDENDNFWFGTNAGITVYNPKSKKPENIYTYYNQKINSIGNQIRFLEKDKNNNIWIGTSDNGVTKYNISEKRFIYNPRINQYFSSIPTVNALVIDDRNTLWLGSTDGLIFYNINTMQYGRVSQTDGLSGNDITALYTDSKGSIWVGARNNGLSCITDTIINQIDLDINITPKCINEDNNGNIIIGTSIKGVIVYDREKVIKKYNIKNGLLSNQISLINVDNNNNIFIGTNKGLNKISSEGNITTYTTKNGFTGIEALNNASYKDKYNHIWFGTVNGVIKYQPEFEKTTKPQPLTNISRFRVNMKDRSMDKKLRLKHTENSIIFNYNSICLENPDVVEYQTKLEGADKDWLPITKQTMVNYSSLSANKYTFLVKAKNSSGQWNTEPASYSFVINPPFYARWWFILSCIIIIVVSIISYIKNRERNLIYEKKILEEKIAERTAEVVKKSNELEQKNSDILGSIKYAQRIQNAILPPNVPFEKTFMFFRPKDIVSGDFYWMESFKDKEMFAAVDCTGHGVPGAFLSIMGHSMLTKIVKEYKILEPAEILNRLNLEISDALHQKDDMEAGIINDGMDLALVSYDKKNKTLEYAGAYNPLILIRNGEVIETKGNRFPIGRSMSKEKREFTNHKFNIQKGDTIYIFSDGYADQFGGPDNKKFRKKNMLALLQSIQDIDIKKHGKELEKSFNNWKGDEEQIDDIVFIGRRF